MLPVDGAIFVVITRQDKRTGLTRSTHQMAYLCQKTEELVLSREAMTSLGMVNVDINNAASVRQITTSPPSSGDGSGCGPGCRSGSGPRCGPSCGGRQDEAVTGGQLTLDLIASYNQMYPGNQDLRAERASRELRPVEPGHSLVLGGGADSHPVDHHPVQIVKSPVTTVSKLFSYYGHCNL